jgi:hypothetical protein
MLVVLALVVVLVEMPEKKKGFYCCEVEFFPN